MGINKKKKEEKMRIFSIPIDVIVVETHWGIARTATQGTVASVYTYMASLSVRDLTSHFQVHEYLLLLL
jgi:hypothetical protein